MAPQTPAFPANSHDDRVADLLGAGTSTKGARGSSRPEWGPTLTPSHVLRPCPSDRGLLGFPSERASAAELRGLSLSGLRRGLQPGVLFPQHSGRCTYWGMGSGQEGVLPGRPRSCQRERDRPGEPQGWGGVRGQPGELGLLLSHLNKPSGDVRDGPCGSGQPP